MVCNPSQNNINISSPGPSPSLPGLGLPFSIPKLPLDIDIPDGVPEDILELIDKLFALLPAGIKLIPNADAFTKGIWDILANLFNQLAPFLAFYRFIQALLNIILCIIDVLCALFKPRAALRAIKRLFKRCLPDFLALFPWLALLIMILALILLLIALIKYIIEVIKSYIDQIIENIKVLTRAIQIADSEAILAAVNKLSYLICLIEQLFCLLLAISALFAVIRSLMLISGRGVCARGSSCCTEDFCPSFIADSPDGQFSGTGHLIYHRGIGVEIPANPLFDFLRTTNISLRLERWQFIDDSPGDISFLDIITPSPEFGFTYWPEGEVYDSDANILYVPYLLDMNISLDPSEFGNPSDTEGYREFSIQNIIISKRPTRYPIGWDNETQIVSPVSGALYLVGGEVYEVTDDGYQVYNIGSEQATLETLISLDKWYSTEIPSVDDGYNFLDISYNFRYNHEALIDKKMIGLMCQPDVAIETAIFNAEFSDLRSVFDKVGDLPDIGTLSTDRTGGTGALGDLAKALTKFRGNINEDSANILKDEVDNILGSLLDDAEDFYCRGSVAAADRFSSDFEIDPDLQFIGSEIQVTVRLRDKSGTQIGVNIDETLAACIGKSITSTATLGEVSSFEYDGYGDFIAVLTSSEPGEGILSAFISNEIFAEVINRDDDESASEIISRTLSYEFIDKSSTAYREGDGGVKRFGPPDIAQDGK